MSNEQTAVEAGKEVSAKLQGVMKTIEELTVLELADLVKALEVRFGVSAASVAVAAPAGGGGAAGLPGLGNRLTG